MCLGDAASAGSRDDKLSVIGGKLGSATNSGGGGAFADSGSGDESELDFDKWQVSPRLRLYSLV